MGKVRHGVAGMPIEHSLSPVLTAIVHAHLSRTEGIVLPGLKGVVVIPTDGVENALAWGYAGTLPSPDPSLMPRQTAPQQQQAPPPRKEMSGPPNINDILNNMNSSSNKVDIDMNSNYSESDMEGTKNINLNRNKRSLNLDI